MKSGVTRTAAGHFARPSITYSFLSLRLELTSRKQRSSLVAILYLFFIICFPCASHSKLVARGAGGAVQRAAQHACLDRTMLTFLSARILILPTASAAGLWTSDSMPITERGEERGPTRLRGERTTRTVTRP